jgi:GNAT superfamily N-acetyltransferase
VIPPSWQEAPLSRDHDRTSFDCGVDRLNTWLARYARQNHESGSAKTFVAVAPEQPARILGFYSLSPTSLDYERTPAVVKRGLGRYDVPAILLARLAVDLSVQGHGLGSGLFFAAGRRCLAAADQIGGVALVIDAKDERAARWYHRLGAVPFHDEPLKLVLPFAVFRSALSN